MAQQSGVLRRHPPATGGCGGATYPIHAGGRRSTDQETWLLQPERSSRHQTNSHSAQQTLRGGHKTASHDHNNQETPSQTAGHLGSQASKHKQQPQQAGRHQPLGTTKSETGTEAAAEPSTRAGAELMQRSMQSGSPGQPSQGERI